MHFTITMSPYGSLAPQGSLDPWWSRNLSTCRRESCRCKWAERLALARAALWLRCHDGSACLRRSVAFAATEPAEGKAKGCKQATHGITLASCRRRGDMRRLEPATLEPSYLHNYEARTNKIDALSSMIKKVAVTLADSSQAQLEAHLATSELMTAQPSMIRALARAPAVGDAPPSTPPQPKAVALTLSAEASRILP